MIAHLLYRVYCNVVQKSPELLSAHLSHEGWKRAPFFNHYAFPRFAVMVVNHSHWLVDS
jgi:hypothetical protein